MKKALQQASEMRKWLKSEWDDLWITKHDDKIMAEGVSIKKYSLLDVDRGEIIRANRDYKPLSFHSILQKNIGKDLADKVDVDPETGGWGKFTRDNFTRKRKEKPHREKPEVIIDNSQQQRKGGAGWLNKSRIRRKGKKL